MGSTGKEPGAQSSRDVVASIRPSGSAERRFAAVAAGVLVAFTVAWPVAPHERPALAPVLLGVYAAAFCLVQLVTTSLLVWRAVWVRSLPAAVLAGSFVFVTPVVVLYTMMSLAAASAPVAPLGSMGWLFLTWRLWLPAAIAAYALTPVRGRAGLRSVLLVATGCSAAVLGLVLVPLLPALSGPGHVPTPVAVALNRLAFGLAVAALALVVRMRPQTSVETWFAVALAVAATRYGFIAAAGSRDAGSPDAVWMLAGLLTIVLVSVALGCEFVRLLEDHTATLHVLTDDLRRATQSKTDFVATLSHELRTPLTAIVGGAELLRTAGLDARGRTSVRMLDDASATLLRLINRVLDFSKIEAGKMELAAAPFDAGSVVDAAVAAVSASAREKALKLVAFTSGGMPLLRGDGERLGIVLENLLRNAIVHTERGTVTVRAELAGENGSAVWVRFEVIDTGSGIASRRFARLFEPFERAEEPSPGRSGTGLGLAISQWLIGMMGGRIEIETAVAGGTTFRFTVPFEALPAGTVPVVDTAGGPETPPGRRACAGPVLVAEDDARLRRLLELQFADLQTEVVFVEDGAAAAGAVRERDFAIAFMDVHMPVLDGLSATRAIRREESAGRRDRLPIVAMTGDAYEEDRIACLAAGMDDYLAKPVRLGDIRRMLERWACAGVTP